VTGATLRMEFGNMGFENIEYENMEFGNMDFGNMELDGTVDTDRYWVWIIY
jgi:hypothetical protein